MVVLKDVRNDTILKEQGYILLDFLSEDEVQSLLTEYKKFHPTEQSGLYASAHHQDFNFRIKMSKLIYDVLAPKFNLLSSNFRLLGSSFLSKSSKGNGILSPHQDWNIVDENEYTSYNLWVPLVDVNKENGTIQLIKGSHLWYNTLRGPNIESAYKMVEKKIMPLFFPIEIPAGTALIYDHRLLHFSDNNCSNQNRLVTVSGISPKSTTNYYYYGEGNFVGQYYLQEDFYLKHNIFEGNKILELKQKINYRNPKIDINKYL